MQIRWNDVSRTDQPGVYRLRDGRLVKITAVEIARWRNNPEGVFETYYYPGTPQRPALLTLTTFRAPSDDMASAAHPGPL